MDADEPQGRIQNITSQMTNTTPEYASQWLRQVARSYAVSIAGARGYVDSACDNLDAIHQKYSKKVDKRVKDALSELRVIAQG